MKKIFIQPQYVTSLHFTIKISIAAITGAVYFVLTFFLAPISFLQVQIRVAEALIGLVPIFGWPVLLGMSIGCAFANIFSPLGWIDIIIGTGATIIGGLPVTLLRKKILPYFTFIFYILSNAFLVAFELWYILSLPYWLSVGFVALGEVIACYGFGLPIYFAFSGIYKTVQLRKEITDFELNKEEDYNQEKDLDHKIE